MLVVRVVPFLGLAIVPVSHKTRKHRNNIDSRFIGSEAPPGVIVVLVVDGFKICLDMYFALVQFVLIVSFSNALALTPPIPLAIHSRIRQIQPSILR